MQFRGEHDLVETLENLASVAPDDLEFVLTQAAEEITYLRRCFVAVQRGAKPIGDFWAWMRRQPRPELPGTTPALIAQVMRNWNDDP